MNTKSTVECPLVKMVSMCLEEPLPIYEAQQQSNGRIRYIVKRQKRRCCEIVAACKQQEEPTQQQADWQATDVT